MPPVILCYDGSDDAAVAIERAAELFPDRPAVVLAAWPRAHTQFIYAWPNMVIPENLEDLDAAASAAAVELADKGAALAVRRAWRPNRWRRGRTVRSGRRSSRWPSSGTRR